MIGGVGVLLAPIPFVFYKYGESIRVKSKFAPTEDKKPSLDDEEKQTPSDEDHPERRRSELSTDEEEERELDDIAGVPSEEELQKQIEEEREKKTGFDDAGEDEYLDGQGLEKRE